MHAHKQRNPITCTLRNTRVGWWTHRSWNSCLWIGRLYAFCFVCENVKKKTLYVFFFLRRAIFIITVAEASLHNHRGDTWLTELVRWLLFFPISGVIIKRGLWSQEPDRPLIGARVLNSLRYVGYRACWRLRPAAATNTNITRFPEIRCSYVAAFWASWRKLRLNQTHRRVVFRGIRINDTDEYFPPPWRFLEGVLDKCWSDIVKVPGM